jgi:hypothetical protein
MMIPSTTVELPLRPIIRDNPGLGKTVSSGLKKTL